MSSSPYRRISAGIEDANMEINWPLTKSTLKIMICGMHSVCTDPYSVQIYGGLLSNIARKKIKIKDKY